MNKIIDLIKYSFTSSPEELSSSDPALCLSYLAHSMLFVNNLSQNGNHEQKSKFLPDACSGNTIGQ